LEKNIYKTHFDTEHMEPPRKKRKRRRKMPTRVVWVPDGNIEWLDQQAADNKKNRVEEWECREAEQREVKRREAENQMDCIVKEFAEKYAVKHPNKRYSLRHQIAWWNTQQIVDLLARYKGTVPFTVRCDGKTLCRGFVAVTDISLVYLFISTAKGMTFENSAEHECFPTEITTIGKTHHIKRSRKVVSADPLKTAYFCDLSHRNCPSKVFTMKL